MSLASVQSCENCLKSFFQTIALIWWNFIIFKMMRFSPHSYWFCFYLNFYQPDWILKLVTLFETMGSVVFTWGLFEVILGARSIIPIFYPCFALDKVESKITLLKCNWGSKSGKLECLYSKLYLFYSLPIENLCENYPFIHTWWP